MASSRLTSGTSSKAIEPLLPESRFNSLIFCNLACLKRSCIIHVLGPSSFALSRWIPVLLRAEAERFWRLRLSDLSPSTGTNLNKTKGLSSTKPGLAAEGQARPEFGLSAS
jgi:hypothetical protein